MNEQNLKKCDCEWCIKWSPIVQKIMNQLDEESKQEFDDLIMHYACIEDDLGATQAKLEGVWPGWEFMKGVLAEHGMKA